MLLKIFDMQRPIRHARGSQNSVVTTQYKFIKTAPLSGQYSYYYKACLWCCDWDQI